jgi:hypothetical protein
LPKPEQLQRFRPGFVKPEPETGTVALVASEVEATGRQILQGVGQFF